MSRRPIAAVKRPVIDSGRVIADPTTTAYAPASSARRTSSGCVICPSTISGTRIRPARRSTISQFTDRAPLVSGVNPYIVVATASAPASSAATDSSNVATSASTGLPNSSRIRRTSPAQPSASLCRADVQSSAITSALARAIASAEAKSGVIEVSPSSFRFHIPITGSLVSRRNAVTHSAPLARRPPAPPRAADIAIRVRQSTSSSGSPGAAWQETINLPLSEAGKTKSAIAAPDFHLQNSPQPILIGLPALKTRFCPRKRKG